MKSALPLAFVALLLTTPAGEPISAAVIDVSAVEFVEWLPDPTEPGQRPTSITYKYRYDKENAFTVSASFGLLVTLSANSILGDEDDIPIGTLNTVTSSVGGNSGSVMATTSNPSGISSFLIPASTARGDYNAFLVIAPRSPHVDPDVADAIGQLPSLVSVGLAGDFDGDGDVDSADLTEWSNGYGQSGPNLSADADHDDDVDGADFLTWQRQVGRGGATSRSAGAVPEPAALALGVGVALVGVRRRHRTSPARS